MKLNRTHTIFFHETADLVMEVPLGVRSECFGVEHFIIIDEEVSDREHEFQGLRLLFVDTGGQEADDVLDFYLSGGDVVEAHGVMISHRQTIGITLERQDTLVLHVIPIHVELVGVGETEDVVGVHVFSLGRFGEGVHGVPVEEDVAVVAVVLMEAGVATGATQGAGHTSERGVVSARASQTVLDLLAGDVAFFLCDDTENECLIERQAHVIPRVGVVSMVQVSCDDFAEGLLSDGHLEPLW